MQGLSCEGKTEEFLLSIGTYFCYNISVGSIKTSDKRDGLQMDGNRSPVGVLDSGVGGISVLRELVRVLPGEDFIYYGDSANAPYGTKTAEEISFLTNKSARFLLDRGAKALVVACNTATSVAIKELRQTYESLPIIGIEPALKPAVLAKEHSRILVMATPMTLMQEKFGSLMHSYESEAEIIKVPCPGLVELIEEGILEGETIERYLRQLFLPCHTEQVDAVVLGCTHYPLIRPSIAKVLPAKVRIYDGGNGTARETRRRLEAAGLLSVKTFGGTVEFYNSRETKEMLSLCRKLMGI